MSYYFCGITFLNRDSAYSPPQAMVSIMCDDATDLPSTADIQTNNGYTPMIGSTAAVINDSDTYTLNSQGTWIKAENSMFENVYTKTETDNLLADKADAADVYTKTEADNLLADKQDELVVGTNLDGTVTDGSDNPVTSNAVYDKFDEFTTNYVIGNIFEENTSYDLNDYVTPCVWRSRSGAITANISHVPADIQTPNTTRGFRLEVSYVSSNLYVRQVVIPAWNANAADCFYVRHYRSSGSPPQQGWSNWYLYAGTDTGS